MCSWTWDVCPGGADTLLQVITSSPSHFGSPELWFLSIFVHSPTQ